MNLRLRLYGQEVQELTREKEILRAKTRVHDEIGHVLLQTGSFSPARGATRRASAPSGGKTPIFCWENMRMKNQWIPLNSFHARRGPLA